MKEHRSGNSAISYHIQNCDCNAVANNFRILSTGRSDLEIKIKEALAIKKDKPKLNNQLFQNGASFILNIF